MCFETLFYFSSYKMRIAKSLKAEVVEAAVNIGTPVGDITIDIPKKGSLLFNEQDSLLYFGNGTIWVPAGGAPPTQISNVTNYTAPDPHVTIVQQTLTFSAKIFSGVYGGVYILEFYNSYTGQNNGTPQIVDVSISDLPGFASGWSNWSTYTNINTPALNGLSLSAGTVSWTSPTTIRFQTGNTASVQNQNWKFSFVE